MRKHQYLYIMFKIIRLFLLFLAAFAGLGASAQNYVVSGNVRNAKSGAKLEFVSAVLLRADSTGVSSTMTDENGAFSLKAKAAGDYIVKLSSVGFVTLYKNVRLTAGRDSVNVGTLNFSDNDNVLGTATVTVAAARVEQKEDTTVYNASAYRVPEGSSVEALIKQLPGVEVGDDGKITWNGKEVKEFLVNGKDFFKGDTDVAMKNLPTDLVSRIKAYDKKSDYYEETGIDDGEETTVLDIATKRKFNESLVSNIDLGYGTEDRYTGKVFASYFTDLSRVTLFGSANNLNDQGFGGPRGFGGGGGGLTSVKDGGVDFTWENGKKKREAGRFEVGGNVRYRHTSNDLVSISSSETFLTGGKTSSFSNSHSVSGSSSTQLSGSFRLKWSPDSMTNVNFRPSFTYSDSKNDGNSRTATFNDDPYEIEGMFSPLDSLFADDPALMGIAVNRNSRLTLGDSKNINVSGSLNVTRRLNSEGRNVSFRASGGYSKGESHSYSISDIKYYAAGQSDSYLNQYSDTPSKNWNYSLRLGYVEPLGNKWFAEAQYQYSYRYNDSDRSRYNLDSLKNKPWAGQLDFDYAAIGTLPGGFYDVNGTYWTQDDILNSVRDDYNSQYATYKYQNHNANVGIRYNSEAIRFNAGLDFNPEITDMSYIRPGQNIDTLITRNVFKVSPRVNFRYRFNKTTQLEVRYRGSSSQPSMTDLLAVVDDSNPLSISMGNPGLKPSWNNNLRISYRGYNAERQQGMMTGLDFSQTSNSISNRRVYDETTGVSYLRPENINGNWNARGHFMFNTAFGPGKLFNIMTASSLSYSNNVGYVSNLPSGSLSEYLDGTYEGYNRLFGAVSSSKNTTRTLGVNERLHLTYRTGMFDFGVNGSFNYQHARATVQENANMDTWNFSYGANANISFDWGMSISTDISMSSRRGYSAASMNTNELLWNAQISQTLLKNKATLSLQFYDILHEQSNVSRTLSAMMRSDSWTNAINSYCMLHFIYRLNIFGGGGSKGSDKGGEGAPGMRGPGAPNGAPIPPAGMRSPGMGGPGMGGGRPVF